MNTLPLCKDNNLPAKQRLEMTEGTNDDEDDLDDGGALACDGSALASASAAPSKTHVARWRTRVFAIQCLRKIVTQPFSENDVIG